MIVDGETSVERIIRGEERENTIDESPLSEAGWADSFVATAKELKRISFYLTKDSNPVNLEGEVRKDKGDLSSPEP